MSGLYERSLCTSCFSSCQSFRQNPGKPVGAAGLPQACRYIADSCPQGTAERLDNLEDSGDRHGQGNDDQEGHLNGHGPCGSSHG